MSAEDREKLLRDAIDRKAPEIFPQTKQELVDFYKEEYGKQWKQQIVKDLALETGKKSKNLERRFDPSRLNNPEARNAKQYVELGKKLPAIGRHFEGSITITVKGTQVNDRKGGRPRDRTVSVTFTGSRAYEFIENPSYMQIWEEYELDPPDLFEEGTYALQVGSVS